MKEVSPKPVTRYYLATLLLVASLCTLCHFALLHELNRSASSAAITSLSGRQRMLSQRIAAMAAEYRLQVPGSRDSLLRSADIFEQNSRELLDRITAMPHEDPIRNTLLQIYLDGPTAVQARSQLFVSQARMVAGAAANSPNMIPVSNQLFEQARSPLLDRLAEIVTVEQKESDANIRALERIQNILFALILLTLLLEALLIFRPLLKRITVLGSTLTAVASTDPLTGLQNRRAFLETGDTELDRARRYHRPLSLLMLDVDHFKAINDSHGHGAGDLVLETLANAITQTLRLADRSGRLGGEEFAILLPETDLASATLVAERLRIILASLEVTYGETTLRVTVSIGVSQVASTVSNLTEALVFADRALYRAKALGRNRVVTTNQAAAASPAAQKPGA